MFMTPHGHYQRSRTFPLARRPAGACCWWPPCRPSGAAIAPLRARPCTSRSRPKPNLVPAVRGATISARWRGTGRPGDGRPGFRQSEGYYVKTPVHGDLPGGPSSGPCWVKSSLSLANGNCVEVAGMPDGGVGVRNSRDTGGPVLRFTPGEWHAFLGGVRNGEFDSEPFSS